MAESETGWTVEEAQREAKKRESEIKLHLLKLILGNLPFPRAALNPKQPQKETQ